MMAQKTKETRRAARSTHGVYVKKCKTDLTNWCIYWRSMVIHQINNDARNGHWFLAQHRNGWSPEQVSAR